jgi:C_GCAxxG_C_C family probable redox protein
MSDNSDAAVNMFMEGYNCAQSVLAGCGRDYGLPRDTAVKVAQAFGGGVARTGNLCGAVTGALMVIGLKRAVKDPKDAEARDAAYRLAKEFIARFQARHGATLCRDLLGCDLSTDEGLRHAHETGLTRTTCPKFIRDAVAILEDLLREPLEPPPKK